MTMGNHVITVSCLQLRGLVHSSHDGKLGSMQANVLLGKELRVLTPCLTGNRKWSVSLGVA